MPSNGTYYHSEGHLQGQYAHTRRISGEEERLGLEVLGVWLLFNNILDVLVNIVNINTNLVNSNVNLVDINILVDVSTI